MKYAQLTIIGVALLFVFGIVVWKAVKPDKYHSPERITWKEQAVRELRNTDFHNDRPTASDLYEDWYHPHFLLMKNGEAVFFRTTESKSMKYLFICRASNNQWYYSSNKYLRPHALDVMSSGQPDSLDDLVDEHSLQEFDSYSDDCLIPIN